ASSLRQRHREGCPNSLLLSSKVSTDRQTPELLNKEPLLLLGFAVRLTTDIIHGVFNHDCELRGPADRLFHPESSLRGRLGIKLQLKQIRHLLQDGVEQTVILLLLLHILLLLLLLLLLPLRLTSLTLGDLPTLGPRLVIDMNVQQVRLGAVRVMADALDGPHAGARLGLEVHLGESALRACGEGLGSGEHAPGIDGAGGDH
ncbi:hypothetical protein B0T18DRAFT_464020, partial [Schizothecium vesticola]